MDNKRIKLYNMMLPLWLLWLFPQAWLFIAPMTFLIDSIVLILTLKFLKQSEIFKKYKKMILKVWIFGFIADIPCVLFLLVSLLLPYEGETGFSNWWYQHMTNSVPFNPFANIFAFLYVLIAVFIAFVLIYILNLKITFKNSDMDGKMKKRTAFFLALFTSPWLFFIPSIWFY